MQSIIGALYELSTERPGGMGIQMIPISKVWQYLERYDLPDWWEPVLLQADAAIVAGYNREQNDRTTHSPSRIKSSN